MQFWTVRQKIGEMWGGSYDLLEVIEQQQHLSIPKIVMQLLRERAIRRLPQSKSLSNGRYHPLRVAHRSQRNEADAIGKLFHHFTCDLKPQASFAHTACTRKREKAHFRPAQQGTNIYHLSLAS